MIKGYLLDFDQLNYLKALELQRKLVDLRNENKIPETLILLEHEHVITIGNRGKEADILDKSLPYYYVERGGELTYHGPGQLVGYPIFDLKSLKLDVKEFVSKLESAICLALKKFNIECDKEHVFAGVWTKKQKIASIGIALKNFVTFHGFALNVNTDLSYFFKIRPCGMEASVMTSMEKILGEKINMKEVKDAIIEGFQKVFDIEFERKSLEDLALKLFE
ncbi:MAG TPA: lipoyl(octanoyl) transferase LipB [Geobacterales bacterium]|nr:lipoyl(octanoyl) transferase LipB [Geobacterales bacterium]